jgi:TolB-like protein
MKNSFRTLAIALPLAFAGCANDSPTDATSSVTIGATASVDGNLATLAYRSVDLLLAGAPDVTRTTPLIVSSISDADHVERSSRFGNILADMIRTRLAQDGHSAAEIRLRERVSFNRGEGEFLLSRDRRALMRPPFAAAIVTGTYAASFESVYVSIKLVSATDAHILSGADFVLPLAAVSGLLPRFSSNE